MSNGVMCTACSGSGIGPSGDTSSTCYECNGSGGVILRDERGRFMKFVLEEREDTSSPTTSTTLLEGEK